MSGGAGASRTSLDTAASVVSRLYAMAAPGHYTLRLAAADAADRRRAILEAYREHRSLERAAAALRVPTRTLCRWVERDATLARALERARSVTRKA